MLLVDDLLTLPFRGLFGIFEKIREMAERELNDEAYLKEKLLEVELRYEMGEIGEEEYQQQAALWEARVNAARGMGEEEESTQESRPDPDSKAAA